MVNISTANPSKKPFLSHQANSDWPMSLSLFGLPTGQKQKGQRLSASAQLYSHSCGAPVALQRCPILHISSASLSPFFPVLSKGDISTLLSKGHFYFALTMAKMGGNGF